MKSSLPAPTSRSSSLLPLRSPVQSVSQSGSFGESEFAGYSHLATISLSFIRSIESCSSPLFLVPSVSLTDWRVQQQ